MAKDYFNRKAMLKIIDMQAYDPYSAKKMYEEYLIEFPNDYNTYILYANVLTTIGLLDDAEKVLNDVKDAILRDKVFMRKYKDRLEKIDLDMLLATAKLLCYQNKYEELRVLCRKYNAQMKEVGLNSLVFFCMKKCGVLTDDPSKHQLSYSFSQIVSYNHEKFLEHIKPHFALYSDEVTLTDSYFLYDFPLQKVIEEVKKNIPSDKKLYVGTHDNIYYFKYDDCGKCGAKSRNYFKVVCLHNSTDIITMYPCDEGEKLPYVDLNYIKGKQEEKPVKRKSQTEKFRARYQKDKPNT